MLGFPATALSRMSNALKPVPAGLITSLPGGHWICTPGRGLRCRKNRPQDAPPPSYYVSLEPGGNYAAIGFRLRTGTDLQDFPHRAFIKLDAEEWRFSGTFLHETGHVVLAILTGGQEIPKRQLASIPHTTAALSDRGTAFDEGFAIHLETLAAHFSSDPEMRGRFRHERTDFGPARQRQSEYFRHALDLMSYSQNIARYYEVRENNFAFAPAYRGPDYLRVQLEKSRDFAALRDADQLLQSEGFHASFFFAYTVRGDRLPTPETVRARQDKLLAALAAMLADKPLDAESPLLPRLIETYIRQNPDDAGEVVDVLLDLSHGVFVDADAAALWKECYLAALRLDMANLPTERIQAARTHWHEAVLKDPQVLYARLGPQLPCEVPERKVKLVALGRESPLHFDVNTVEEGILRLIPGITEPEIAHWQTERASKPFADVADFKVRCGLTDDTLARLQF